jgi:low affinity Fe/Cu permease
MFENICIIALAVIGVIVVLLIGDRFDLKSKLDSLQYDYTLLRAQADMTHTKVVTLESNSRSVIKTLGMFKEAEVTGLEKKVNKVSKRLDEIEELLKLLAQGKDT